MSGWFAVKRGITKHPIFEKRPDRLAVWLWLLDNAVWKDTPHDVKGQTVIVPAGSVCASLRRIASETGVPIQALRTFLERLQKEHMINTSTNTGKTVISLCNWDKYQTSQHSNNTEGNTGGNTKLTQDQHTKEQVNNIPVGTAPLGASEIVEFEGVRASVWKAGKALLARHGKANPSVIGKWLKQASAVDVLSAIEAAEKAQTQDPVPYITAALTRGPSRSFRQQDQDQAHQNHLGWYGLQ